LGLGVIDEPLNKEIAGRESGRKRRWLMADELQTFINTWDAEAKKTSAMLRALPTGQYDFRPDPGGRSLGELAWHLAEIDAYSGFGIERGLFEMGVMPPGI